jgi:ribosome-binding factor A
VESVRQNKIARLLQKELAEIFQKESRNMFKGRLVTVTVVRITPDLTLARVYLSIFPLNDNEDFDQIMNRNIKTVRTFLGKRVRHQLRNVPELLFFQDDSLDYIDNINRLLKS